jgi:sulfite reductase alpha subunit-like flavoprotein
MVAANDRFRLPQKDPSAPVLMIGPGTGVAPFRGFVQALEAEEGQRPATLFFGCRNEKDYLYRSELEASTKLELHTAFSRPITSDSTTMSKKKEYVQDLLWKNRDQVWEMLQHNEAHIYICGDGRHMAKDVDNTLHRIAEESGKMSQSDAITFFETLQENDRYLQDVWCN